MRNIPLQDIQVPETRQRLIFDPEEGVKLAESIERVGLINPILIRPMQGYNGTKVMLIAGERRLRAIKTLTMMGKMFTCNGEDVPLGHVPCLHLGEVTELKAFEAELEENIRRMDLSWQERAQALKALDDLRKAQNPQHTTADLAQEVTGSRANPNRLYAELVVARNLSDPEVAKAKTSKDAFKILLRKEQEHNNELHAAMVGKTFSARDHTLLMGDCIGTMAAMPAGVFDCIVTDPPYGMDADAFGDAAGKLLTIDHKYSDSLDHFKALLIAAEEEISRVAKEAAHLYICCDIDQFPWLRELFGKSWNVFRTPLINCKQGSGRVPLPEHGPRRQWEAILYAYRGGRKCNAIYSDVISSQGDVNLGHGAQKPVGLFTDLLRRSVRAGDSVLDPFCGTGTIFAAAHELQCRATGIEQEAKYFGIAAQRIEGLT